MSLVVSRRSAMASFAAFAGALLSRGAGAMGRTPLGGKLALHVPWSLASIDPHELGDGAAALFGPAISDPLFAIDASGAPYPALADGAPERVSGETIVRLREGLRTAHGVALSGRDVVASIERARARGAAAWLTEVPRPAVRRDDPLAVSFGSIEPFELAHVLASPLVALLPRHFSPTAPDGTGAFSAELTSSGLGLTRSPNAARGNAFLDAIDVAPAPDLSTSLREFEAEHDDIGWLGMGLHDVRTSAERFDFGGVAIVVLAQSGDAGSFGVPGVLQRLVDAIPTERLAHLGLGPSPPASGDPGWGGPPVDLVVDAGSPHLLEVARAVAPILTRASHEVTIAPVPRAEIAKRKTKGGPAVLSIEIVRPFAPGARGLFVALASADDLARAKDLARHAPVLARGTSARTLASSLRLGVLGEVRVAGGVSNRIALARHANEGWDLGSTHKRTR